MPYASGEKPCLGDYVRNEFEQPGTVVAVSKASNSDGEVVAIRWDDGGDSPLTSATEFKLIARESQ